MEQSLQLTVATPSDAGAVADVLKASYPKLMREAYEAAILQRALPVMVRANPKLLASGTYYLATSSDGVAVGCGGWTLEHPATDQIELGVGHLRHFATRPEYTGRGIGRTIYNRCETQACAAGVTVLDVYASLSATAFYASLGFDAMEKIVVAMGPDTAFPSVWMRRSISVA